MKHAIFVLIFMLFPVLVMAETIHVPDDQPTIQAGIDAAVDGDTVLVADGTYTGEGNRNIDFLGKAIIVRSENGAENCFINCEWEGRGFNFHNGEGQDSVLQGFTIGNGSASHGGGILCVDASPTIDNNIINRNRASGSSWPPPPLPGAGGGIYCLGSSSAITNNAITGNHSNFGGGICCDESSTIINCNIIGNEAHQFGPSSGGYGGGIFCEDSLVTITNTILWANESPQGAQISGYPTVTYSDVQGGWSGEGNIAEDPLFVTGPDGDHYLSQIAAGQAEDSPCVNTGDPLSDMIEGTTRTDSFQDTGVVDMGYHYRNTPCRVVAGPGAAYENPTLVRVIPPEQDAVHEYEFEAYGPDQYGVNVTCGDVDGDLLDNILTGAGPGDIYGPHVRGFVVDGTPLPGLSFLAYGTNKYGVNVAAGDLDADGFDEIITGAGPGAVFGPHVRAWNYDGTGAVTSIPGVSYFAYGSPKWGVNVSAGDIDGDGFDEIVTGAGPGAVYGPHVRGWNVSAVATAMLGVNFLAYGTNNYGVNVTCGDVDGDGIDEIVTGPGPSDYFGAHIRGWNVDGGTATAMTSLSFFAWPSSEARYGANVFAGADLNGDGRDELVVGCGPDPGVGTPVKVFLYDGSQVTEWFSLEAFEDVEGERLTHGANVAAGRF